jgi:L-lactate dehydrogenase complex protein LldF
VGITGGNFISAESGRIALVTNEGNSRFSLAAPKIHIALIGIEKLLPHDRDFQIMLNLLGRSATGQQLTVYTEFIGGPKHPDQPDGPEQMHVVLLDNRRTEILAGNCREMLRCIRCGACLNVCPIYRQSSGHAYRSVYPGPMGAVLTPLFAGEKFAQFADLPKASSLCGACNEVCPVDIPIPDLLLKLRDRAKREGIKSPGTPPMGMWSLMATSPVAWKTALKASNVANSLPLDLIPVPALKDWTNSRTLPKFEGGSFRKWMKTRKGSK